MFKLESLFINSEAVDILSKEDENILTGNLKMEIQSLKLYTKAYKDCKFKKSKDQLSNECKAAILLIDLDIQLLQW